MVKTFASGAEVPLAARARTLVGAEDGATLLQKGDFTGYSPSAGHLRHFLAPPCHWRELKKVLRRIFTESTEPCPVLVELLQPAPMFIRMSI